MSIVSDSELLEHEPEPWRPGRAVKVVAVALVLIAVAAVWTDRATRDEESEALARCAHEVQAAVTASMTPVIAMAGFVRPTRDGAAPALSKKLDAMVSEQTIKVDRRLRPVVLDCSQIHIWRHHTALLDRQAHCLDRLSRTSAYLTEVARNGAIAFRSGPSVTTLAQC